MPNSKRMLYLLLAIGLATPFTALGEGDEWKTVEGDAFTFTEVRDGVWHAVGGDGVAAGSNGAVVVNERDVLLVDSHMTPSAARAMLADLAKITDKPVRYLINTHFHFDHTHGNEAFGPDVEIVAHEFTRWRVASGDTKRGRGYDGFIGSTPQTVEGMRAGLDSLSAEDRAAMERRWPCARRWCSTAAAARSGCFTSAGVTRVATSSSICRRRRHSSRATC
jgi:hypothetical protein